MTASGLPTAETILGALLRPPVPRTTNPSDEELAVIMQPILALHRSNRDQWDREDDARRDQADAIMVAAAKRDIDQLNGARHCYIEAIDRAIAGAIRPCEDAPLVTESPGMAIDRLSVLVIRLASTEARVAAGTVEAGLYTARLPQLRRQLEALEEAIATLLDDLAKGTGGSLRTRASNSTVRKTP